MRSQSALTKEIVGGMLGRFSEMLPSIEVFIQALTTCQKALQKHAG